MFNFYFLKSLLHVINNNDTKYTVCLPLAVMCDLSGTVVLFQPYYFFFEIQSFIGSNPNLRPVQLFFSGRKVRVTLLHPTHG